jgi:hypothetical protein
MCLRSLKASGPAMLRTSPRRGEPTSWCPIDQQLPGTPNELADISTIKYYPMWSNSPHLVPGPCCANCCKPAQLQYDSS